MKAVGVMALAAGLLAGVLTVRASAAAQPRPCMHVRTVGGVKYDTFCGPAAVTFRLGARRYRISGGYCYLDPNRNFDVSVGSVDADKPVGSDGNKILRLSYFGLDTASRRVGNTYAKADVFYVLPGNHPPGESSDLPAKVTVAGRYGSFKVPYAEPALSGSFHC